MLYVKTSASNSFFKVCKLRYCSF